MYEDVDVALNVSERKTIDAACRREMDGRKRRLKGERRMTDAGAREGSGMVTEELTEGRMMELMKGWIR